MTYSLIHSECIGCQQLISYNADHVPSIVVEGQREPLCEACHGEWNQIHRVAHGLEPIDLHTNAYAPKKED